MQIGRPLKALTKAVDVLDTADAVTVFLIGLADSLKSSWGDRYVTVIACIR